MSWTWVLSILALTVPPSAAYVVSLFVQQRIERAQHISKAHQAAIEMHEIVLDQTKARVAELEQLASQQQTTINKLAEREF